jgi:aryl-alcohol dehydrogenase
VFVNVLTAIVNGSSVFGIKGDAVPRESIPALVELRRQGRFPFEELIRVYPFEEIQQAADDAAGGTVLKPVLKCSKPPVAVPRLPIERQGVA